MKSSILLTAIFLGAITANAQQLTTAAQNAEVVDHECTHRTYDLVGPDMRATTDLSVAMQRSVLRTANGHVVRVVNADGILRMTGTYADEALSIEEGTFSFYHPNGELESTGNYKNGLKKGVWMRYDPHGRKLAERVYGVGSYEELALEHGWASMAAGR